MSLPYRCVNGHQFVDDKMVKVTGMSSTGNVFSNIQTNCPVCGAPAKNITGRYDHSHGQISAVSEVSPRDRDFINSVLSAFKAPDVTLEKVAAFKAVAEAAHRGELNDAQAEQRISEINDTFVSVWKLAKKNGWAIALLLTVISIILQCYSIYDSDQSTAQAHKDAQALLSVEQKQLEVSERLLKEQQRDLEVQEKLYALLAEQSQTDSAQAQPPTPQKQMPPPQQRHEKNRHERRKAAALDSKKR